MDSYLEVGKIVNTHALLGEVKALSYGDAPDELLSYEYVLVGPAKEKMEIEGARTTKGAVLLKLRGIDDLTAAERLKGQALYRERESLEPLPEGVYYLADLTGLEAFLENGERLGVVREVLQTGANDVFVIAGEKKEYLIPFIPSCVREVDTKGRRMTITPLEGLLEL